MDTKQHEVPTAAAPASEFASEKPKPGAPEQPEHHHGRFGDGYDIEKGRFTHIQGWHGILNAPSEESTGGIGGCPRVEPADLLPGNWQSPDDVEKHIVARGGDGQFISQEVGPRGPGEHRRREHFISVVISATRAINQFTHKGVDKGLRRVQAGPGADRQNQIDGPRARQELRSHVKAVGCGIPQGDGSAFRSREQVAEPVPLPVFQRIGEKRVPGDKSGVHIATERRGPERNGKEYDESSQKPKVGFHEGCPGSGLPGATVLHPAVGVKEKVGVLRPCSVQMEGGAP